MIGNKISNRTSRLSEQHKRVSPLYRIAKVGHCTHRSHIIGKLHKVAGCNAKPSSIFGMHFEIRKRETAEVKRDELVMIGRLPDVIRAAVINPEVIILALARDFRRISWPRPRGRNEARFSGGRGKLATLMQPDGSDRRPLH